MFGQPIFLPPQKNMTPSQNEVKAKVFSKLNTLDLSLVLTLVSGNWKLLENCFDSTSRLVLAFSRSLEDQLLIFYQLNQKSSVMEMK